MPSELPPSYPTPRQPPAGLGDGSGTGPALPILTLQAFQLRSHQHYALHPVEAALQYHRADAEISGEEGYRGFGFEAAEAHYRAGAQGIRLPEIPQLPQQLRELSRLAPLDRAGRKALRKWAEDHGHVFVEDHFFQRWTAQGKRGGAEHQVYHDQESGRWIKRLYHGVNSSTLGDYLVRMRLHAVLFPETAYLHPVTGVLAHDLHDENVVRLPESEDLAVIDPYISLARMGTWSSLKLAEVGFPPPPDDPFP